MLGTTISVKLPKQHPNGNVLHESTSGTPNQSRKIPGTPPHQRLSSPGAQTYRNCVSDQHHN
ncbi:hypothetical protein GIB67_014270 [Kingdonia uniflora]|uniref:Uncharacterized protein n=1 Tax=Kingdonia uniflora TaxID=39325 RepID=A0A7J7M1Z5_9MAGN|nr:hypothetical protein GIB67_014270 [Kingdonia uniflora]